MRTRSVLALAVAVAIIPACNSGSSSSGGLTIDVPEDYVYTSAFSTGVSSVSYDGQVFRQVLIADLTAYIGGLTAPIDADTLNPSAGDIEAALNGYYEFDSGVSGTNALLLTTTPAASQTIYNHVSSGKWLKEKIAGEDGATTDQHKNWNTPGNFVGWSDAAVLGVAATDIDTPHELVQAFFSRLDELAAARAAGTIPLEPDGSTPIAKVHVTAEGLDLKELIQKFLTMAVSFSQATDDYLDDATAGKGLLSPNTQSGANPWTTLEHQWDEGFGYFGAARDYDDYTDAKIASSAPYQDTFLADGAIDLQSEFCFGASTNAAKRDNGAVVPTDFTNLAFTAFKTGRAIINAAAKAGRELTAEELAALKAQRDIAVAAWEGAIAATVVHYINDTLAEMDDFGTIDYSFLTHAKGWSEMKGFALGLQFNPRSPLSDDDFLVLHLLLGDRPVLPTASDAAIANYKSSLLVARQMLQDAYGFDPANVAAW